VRDRTRAPERILIRRLFEITVGNLGFGRSLAQILFSRRLAIQTQAVPACLAYRTAPKPKQRSKPLRQPERRTQRLEGAFLDPVSSAARYKRAPVGIRTSSLIELFLALILLSILGKPELHAPHHQIAGPIRLGTVKHTQAHHLLAPNRYSCSVQINAVHQIRRPRPRSGNQPKISIVQKTAFCQSSQAGLTEV